jgi:hypothetical protein
MDRPADAGELAARYMAANSSAGYVWCRQRMGEHAPGDIQPPELALRAASEIVRVQNCLQVPGTSAGSPAR